MTWSDKQWKRLADLRSRGVTQIEAAHAMGISTNSIAQRWAQTRQQCRAEGYRDPGPWDAYTKGNQRRRHAQL